MNEYWARDLPPAGTPAAGTAESLRDVVRWLTLLAEEMEALEVEDYPRLREAGERREKLEAELVAALGGEPPAPPRERFAAVVDRALQRLEERAQLDRQREELARLHDGALPRARGFPTPSSGGRYPDPDPPDGRQLNVRL